jgi:hypothetical protein
MANRLLKLHEDLRAIVQRDPGHALSESALTILNDALSDADPDDARRLASGTTAADAMLAVTNTLSSAEPPRARASSSGR